MNDDELQEIVKTEGSFEKFSAFGFDCFAKRGPVGAWCGYVRIPEEHAIYLKDYSDIVVNVHGGLTFSDFCLPNHNEEQGYFIGFDCAHAGDLCPSMFGMFGNRFGDEYRSKEYVKEELIKLANQLRNMGD